MTMSNRQRAAYHLGQASKLFRLESAGVELKCPRCAVTRDRIEWHLFQARFARLQDIMTPAQAFNDAIRFIGG